MEFQRGRLCDGEAAVAAARLVPAQVIAFGRSVGSLYATESLTAWPGWQPGVEFCAFRARLGCEDDLRKTATCRTNFGAPHAFSLRGFYHCI